MAVFFDRVKDMTTTTGTGDITLSGTAPTGYVDLNSAFGVGVEFWYAIVSADESEWEIGQGQLSDAVTLVRSSVQTSSNGGAAVDFSAGTKIVFHTASAAIFNSFVSDIAGILSYLDGFNTDVNTLETDVERCKPMLERFKPI